MQPVVLLRWVARAAGLASGLLLGLFLFGGQEHLRPTAAEAVGMLFFPFGVAAGFAVAWWRDGLGGLVSVGSLGLFYLWLFARAGQVPTTPYFLLFAAPGFLHLIVAGLARGSRRPSE